MLQDEKRGIEEAYQVAGNSSDLRVEGDVRGDADLMIAAGWSDSRAGIALLRLHSEWDRAEKPRKPSKAMIDALHAVTPYIRPANFVMCAAAMDKHWKAEPSMRMEAAKKQAQGWYMDEMAKLVNKLTSLPAVRRELTRYVPKWGIQEAAVKVPAVIAYWLDQTCHHCNGLKFKKIEGAPALSTKACRACNGSGIAPVPHGQEGRRVANYMDECLQKGRDSIRRNLSAYREPSMHKRGAA